MCAAMLINKYLDIDDRKLIFFLAPQVPLVNQQARFIQQQCAKSEVRRLHGQMDVGHESWSHEDWVRYTGISLHDGLIKLVFEYFARRRKCFRHDARNVASYASSRSHSHDGHQASHF